MNQGGDDLEDDYVPDDLVAVSDDEAVDQYHGSPTPDFAPQELERDEGGDLHGNASEGNDGQVDALKEKKRKRREKEKERKRRKLAATEEAAVAESIAARDPQDLADYLSRMQAKTFSKMSALELSDIQIPASAIVDTGSWTGPRSLDQLGDFISKVVPTLRTRLGQKSKSNGSPTLIFVAGAALRVADVTRVLKDKKLRGEKGGEAAKLFAKHFKLSDHISYLKRTKIGSAVGTPGRLGQLLESDDALTTSALTHIILDITYQDAKKRSLLDIPEARDEVFKTILGSPKVMTAIMEGKVQIVLY